MQFIGAEMAIEQINKAGGVNGQQLEGVRYDDACDPKQAVAVANKIVNDEVQFVVGHLCSSSTQPAYDIYADEGILMITAASNSPELTRPDERREGNAGVRTCRTRWAPYQYKKKKKK